ncbi:MAG: methylmalonyl Co-A mutase-associated GTPase MeaB [Melioribacteraceae bacterium]|nr:methylmalonyl Co-A mutase-associated GTPase MeaB [Melioribacteraceae bacterium]
MTTTSLIQSLSLENKGVISRIISIVENEAAESTLLENAVFKQSGKSYKIGITGPPGAGKSTITNQLTKLFRLQDKSVGIIAVDPTSPFTGGALLGDRVRMSEIGLDDKVYIRSMASRGSMGGLSRKAIVAGDVLDAAGFEYIIFETVGVGQSELDIAKAADTTVVTLVPESGDSIQAMKAGLMEIADIFAFNKSDRPGADAAIASLNSIMQFKVRQADEWKTEIVKTVAQENIGIADLADKIEFHRNFLLRTDKLNQLRMNNYEARTREVVSRKLNSEFWDDRSNDFLHQNLMTLLKKVKSPNELADEIYKKYN